MTDVMKQREALFKSRSSKLWHHIVMC